MSSKLACCFKLCLFLSSCFLLTNQVHAAETLYITPEYEIEGNTQRVKVFLGNQKIATTETDAVTKKSHTYWHHSDHLGSANITTDINSKVVEESLYGAYGSPYIENINTPYVNNYLYNNKEQDNGTDLYYYGARYYDPSMNRFTSVDPLALDQASAKKLQEILTDPQQLNAYSYARNNPIKFIDWMGESAIATTIGVASVLLATAQLTFAPDDGLATTLSQGIHKDQLNQPDFLTEAMAQTTKIKYLVKGVKIQSAISDFSDRYNSLREYGFDSGDALYIIGGIDWSDIDMPKVENSGLESVIHKAYGFQFGNGSLSDQISVNDYFGRNDFVDYAKNLQSEISTYIYSNEISDSDKLSAEKVSRDIGRSLKKSNK